MELGDGFSVDCLFTSNVYFNCFSSIADFCFVARPNTRFVTHVCAGFAMGYIETIRTKILFFQRYKSLLGYNPRKFCENINARSNIYRSAAIKSYYEQLIWLFILACLSIVSRYLTCVSLHQSQSKGVVSQQSQQWRRGAWCSFLHYAPYDIGPWKSAALTNLL